MRRNNRFRVLVALSISLFLLVALGAEARPGSGQSYSGDSPSSGFGGGDGGGGDGGVLLEILLYLCIEHPQIGIPLLLLVGVVMIGKSIFKSAFKNWSTTPVKIESVQKVERRANVSVDDLASIRSIDPEFSVVLLEDFLYMLYAAAQRARARGTEQIAAYLSPELAASLLNPNLADVRGIVIGALRYVRFSGVNVAMLELELEIEANLVEVTRQGHEQRYFVVDRVVLTRAHGARSRPFARARTLDCPNCGAPIENLRGTQCNYCRSDVGFGRFDWMIAKLDNRSRQTRGPLLTSDVEERGTELPTVVSSGANQRFAELTRRDPTVTMEAVQTRLNHIFNELQVAWSTRDELRIRPYVSDNLFQSMLYWIDLYKESHCRNVSEQARILRIDLANITSDAYYDAVTLRIFASGIDYTISDDGKLLSGNRKRPRTYSEYWTLIRGTERRGNSRGDSNCPNCGAPLKISMAGNCEYCRVKVTAGEFDWVLSRIEQDDAYGSPQLRRA